MSELSPPMPADGQSAEPTRSLGPAIRDGLTSLSIVLAWFGVAAVIGAVIWWQVTPLAAYTRTSDNATMDEAQLAKQFGTDGWFWVVGSAAGLISGLVLVLLRRRNPILMVLLVTVGGAFATAVMLQLGLLLGPSDPSSVLAHTPVGHKVPLQLKPDAHGVWFAWSISALFGAILALWISEAREDSSRRHPALPGYGPGEQVFLNRP